MLSMIRKRVTFANVALTLGLVFAMSGGAYAAKKYLITSTSQISPKVLSALKGKAGPAGPAGAAGVGTAGAQGPTGPAGVAGAKGETGAEGKEGKQGAPGSPGAKGAAGSPWTVGGTLPEGKTETGVWGIYPRTPEGTLAIPISFTLPLASAPEAIFLKETELSKPGCPGIVNGIPTAEPGKLCVYGTVFEEATNEGFLKTSYGESNLGNLEAGVNLTGTLFKLSCKQNCYAQGTWAVTAE